jgi:ligand-binding sensor domain-containing protein
MLIATERGLLVYDPPTRQLSELSKFPNQDDIFKIQF